LKNRRNCVIINYNYNLERRGAMSVSYDKLWKLLIDKKMNRTELKDSSGISFNVLAKMGKNEFVSMESLMKICATLNCNVGDIMDFLPESEGLQE
jgi:putative transcriptional regulator